MVRDLGERGSPELFFYTVGCSLIFHVFAIQHIPRSGTYLVSVVVQGCLNGMLSHNKRT